MKNVWSSWRLRNVRLHIKFRPRSSAFFSCLQNEEQIENPLKLKYFSKKIVYDEEDRLQCK